MKIKSKKIKKHAQKIKDISEEEFGKVKEQYKNLIGSLDSQSEPVLLLISLVGIFIIIYFRNNFIDLIGLLVFVYPFYLFVKKESLEEGFFEGYYNASYSKKDKSTSTGSDQKK